jgi:hypothetical protein
MRAVDSLSKKIPPNEFQFLDEICGISVFYVDKLRDYDERTWRRNEHSRYDLRH